MKKVILSLTFIFMIGTSFTSSNTLAVNLFNNEDYTENYSYIQTTTENGDFEFCYDEANAIAGSLAIWNNLDFDEEDDIFIEIFEACMEA